MLELLAYLRANGFKTFIVSGGGIEFMRPWAERVYGIPPEQVVGSSIKTKFEMRDGKPVLMTAAEDRLHRRQGPASRSAINSTSAAGRSPPSAIPTATCRCCSGRRPARGARFCLYRPSHRRRARVGLRPHIAHRQARQGAGRGDGERLDGRGYEEGLEARVQFQLRRDECRGKRVEDE